MIILYLRDCDQFFFGIHVCRLGLCVLVLTPVETSKYQFNNKIPFRAIDCRTFGIRSSVADAVAEERALESVMTKLYNFEQLTLAERSELRRIITASDRAVTQEEISDLFVLCVGVGRLRHHRSSKTFQRKKGKNSRSCWKKW
jgi:hypothetical protein